MTSEFKKIKSGNDTRYVLEDASAGGTSSGSIASVPTDLGGVRKRSDNILAQEANKDEAPKPRNFVAKNAKMGGAGKMKDKSKVIPRKAKHKKPVAEELQDRLSELKDRLAVAEGHYVKPGSPTAYDRDYAASTSGMGHKDSLAYQQDGGANDEYVNEPTGSKYQAPQDKPVLQGYYFYNVQPGQEDTAAMYGVKQTKNGKWAKAKYSTSGRSYGMQKDGADKAFGPGKWWAPKNEGVAEGEVVDFPKKHKGDLGHVHSCPKCGGDLQGGKYQGHEVKVCMPCKQVYLPPNSGIDQQGNKIKEGDIERQHGDLKPWAYWNSPERVAQKLYKIHKGAPIGKDEVKQLWKVDGPDRMTKFMVKPDMGAILANYEAMSDQGPLFKESRDMCNVCGQTPCNCTHATDEYMDSLAEMLDLKLAEKIPKGADVDYYIKDFAKSNAPQFKGKTPAKRKQMAIAAYYGSKQKK